MLNKIKNHKRSSFLQAANISGTIFGGLLGIIVGYKLGGVIGAIAGVWFVSVVFGLIFYGLANVLYNVIQDKE